MDNPSHPAFMPGMIILAGNVIIDNTKVATITLPGKYVQFAFGYLDTTTIAPSISYSNDIATITFTAGASGTLYYFLVVNVTEDITDVDAGTSDITITPVS